MSINYRNVDALVEPVQELLGALIRLNHAYFEAMEAGWTVDFTIDPDAGRVNVAIGGRSEWPMPSNDESSE